MTRCLIHLRMPPVSILSLLYWLIGSGSAVEHCVRVTQFSFLRTFFISPHVDMAWLSGLADKAENLLNKIDKNTAAVLNKDKYEIPQGHLSEVTWLSPESG